MIICRCITHEDLLIMGDKNIDDNENLVNILSLLEEENKKYIKINNSNSNNNSKPGHTTEEHTKQITMLKNIDEDKRYYLYSNRFLIFPEFLIEYNYNYLSALTKNNDFIISSYTNKLQLNTESLVDIFNKSAKMLEVSPILSHLKSEDILNLSK